MLVTTGLWAKLETRLENEVEVINFLRGGVHLVESEPETVAWFAFRLGPTSFGIFDVFRDEAGRQAHLSGKLAAALMARASDLFTEPPVIEPIDVLAAKLPSY